MVGERWGSVGRRQVRLLLAALLGVALVVVEPGGTAAVVAQPEELRDQVAMAGNGLAFADPSVLVVDGTAYAFATNSLFPTRNLQVSTSADLFAWTPPREVMPEAPPWAWPMREGGEFWAPTVARFGDRYLLYFAAHHRLAPANDPGWCIGYAEATQPEGPYTPGTKPLICGVAGEEPISPFSALIPATGEGVIDPQVYVAPNGDRYLHFKVIGNRYQIWGAAISGNGITLASPAFGLIDLPDTSATWERTTGPTPAPITIVENPTMHHRGSGDAPYELFYSGDDWRTSDYATGRARCESPLGPCTRITTDEPWMVSRGGVGGPGGASVFEGLDGRPWMAYHAWERGLPTTNGRRLHVEPLGYEGAQPVLLQRPPTGSFSVTTGPGQVTFTGEANDPDTGERLTVSLRDEGVELGEVEVDGAGGFSGTFPASGGMHSFCASILPADGNVGRDLYCQQVEVPPPPIVASAPQPPTGAAP